MGLGRRACCLAWLACAGGVAGPGRAQTPAPEPWPELAGLWPQPARRQAQARFRYFGLAVYDVALWAPQPVLPAQALRQPLALTLHYLRDLAGARIAERSLDEMARGGALSEAQRQRWGQALRQALPDVAEGDRLTGQHRPGEGARFWHNGRLTAEWPDALGAERFFGIWLAPHTSAPALRRELLGGE